MTTNDSIEYLKEIFDDDGVQYVSDWGYKLMRQTNLIINHDQAKAFARIVKDVATANYGSAYAQGKADQALIDGGDERDLHHQIDDLQAKLEEKQ